MSVLTSSYLMAICGMYPLVRFRVCECVCMVCVCGRVGLPGISVTVIPSYPSRSLCVFRRPGECFHLEVYMYVVCVWRPRVPVDTRVVFIPKTLLKIYLALSDWLRDRISRSSVIFFFTALLYYVQLENNKGNFV